MTKGNAQFTAEQVEAGKRTCWCENSAIGDVEDLGTIAETSIVYTDLQSNEDDLKTAKNASQARPRTQNSLVGHEIKTPKPPG